MALAPPMDYAGPVSSGQQHQGCFGVYTSSRLQCVGYEKKSRTNQLAVRAVSMDRSQLDFSNPNWKKQFQEDFDKRFSLPHLRDVIDVEPRPTTFSLKSRWYVCLPFFIPDLSQTNASPHRWWLKVLLVTLSTTGLLLRMWMVLCKNHGMAMWTMMTELFWRYALYIELLYLPFHGFAPLVT